MAPYRARFYNGANAAFLVCDRTRPETLESIKKWFDDIKQSVPKRIPMVIVGNKSDLDELAVSEQSIQAMAEEFGFHYILTSAKTGVNVSDAFNYAAIRFLESIY